MLLYGSVSHFVVFLATYLHLASLSWLTINAIALRDELKVANFAMRKFLMTY